MPQQLIYTSAPQGVDAGRSGYCTVARSSTMGESLIHRLEQLSYYERLSEHGGATERTVFAFRNLDIRGKTFHVLSRIKDAPADYTGRTNFIAHHLVFTPEEVAEMPVPAVIFRRWPHWQDAWREEPRLLENEPWPEREELKDRTFLPANHWYRETGDHARASGLLGFNSGVFVAHQFRPETILDLLSEALDLLQLEGPTWRALAWQRTFSVGCQPQDNPADFRWRFLTSYLPFELAVTQGRAPEELGKLRAAANSRQVEFCKKGPVAPQFTRLPGSGAAVRIREGEPLVLDSEAQSLPGEIIYRWYAVSKDNTTEEEVDGAYTGQLELPNIGRGKWRYKVRAWDSITNKCAESPLLVVEVEEKRRGAPWTPPPSSAPASPVRQSSRESKSPLRVDRPKAFPNSNGHDPGDDRDEEGEAGFYQTHKGSFQLLALVLLLIANAAVYLYLKNFFEPKLGFGNLRERWDLKIRENPVLFENHHSIGSNAIGAIANYKTAKDPKQAAALLERIQGELEKRHLDPRSGSTPQPRAAPETPKQELKSKDKTENLDPHRNETIVEQALVPIYAILADGYWKAPIKPLEDNLAKLKQDEKKATETVVTRTAEKQKPAETQLEARKGEALKKAEEELSATTKKITDLENKTLEPLRKRIAIAGQIDFPKPWPYFPTNGSPILCWAELGQPILASSNRLTGEWRTNAWQFTADKWSVQLSSNRVAYFATNQPRALRANISVIGGAEAPNERLELVLFSPNTNKTFRVQVKGDDILNPGDDLWELIAGLSLQNKNSLRLVGNYSKTKIDQPMTNTLTDIQAMNRKADQWSLGIKQQLTAERKKAERLKDIKMALDRVDIFWKKVKQRHESQLEQSDFATAVGVSINEELKKSFWNQLNRLCIVAIYQIADKPRRYSLDDKEWGAVWVQLQRDMSDEGHSGGEFQTELKRLAEDLKLFKMFWREDYHASSTYQKAMTELSSQIAELEKKGSSMELGSLHVDLQFEARQGVWLTITRLNCEP